MSLLPSRDMYYATGCSVAQFPAHGRLVRAASLSDLGHEMLEGETKTEEGVPVLGLLQTKPASLLPEDDETSARRNIRMDTDDAGNPLAKGREGGGGVEEKENLNVLEAMNMDDAEHNVATEVDSLDVFHHNHNLDVNSKDIHDNHLDQEDDENNAKENNNNNNNLVIDPEKVDVYNNDGTRKNRTHFITNPNINIDGQDEEPLQRKEEDGSQPDGGPAAPRHPRQQLSSPGRVVVYGDSNCLDNSHLQKDCLWLLSAILEYSMAGHFSGVFMAGASAGSGGEGEGLVLGPAGLPKRMEQSTLHKHSKVGGGRAGQTVSKYIFQLLVFSRIYIGQNS